MSRSSCNIRATFDALILGFFSISFNLFNPMDAYVSSENYWCRLWVHMRSAKFTSMNYDTYVCICVCQFFRSSM